MTGVTGLFVHAPVDHRTRGEGRSRSPWTAQGESKGDQCDGDEKDCRPKLEKEAQEAALGGPAVRHAGHASRRTSADETDRRQHHRHRACEGASDAEQPGGSGAGSTREVGAWGQGGIHVEHDLPWLIADREVLCVETLRPCPWDKVNPMNLRGWVIPPRHWLARWTRRRPARGGGVRAGRRGARPGEEGKGGDREQEGP